MITYQGSDSIRGSLHRPKVALGTFDGLHLGHQQVLRDLITWARATGSEAVVVTFDRKPRRVLDRAEADHILSLRHRLKLLEKLGIDAAIVIEFDEDFARMEPEDFVRKVLLDQIGASGVLLGHDTRFGRNARGDFDLLADLGRHWGFETCSVAVVDLDGAPISSTRIRAAIRASDLKLAERMLGRRVSVFGTVVHGTGRGKGLGWPTANLEPCHEVLPPEGVYATRADVNGVWHDSATYIGRAPTLKESGPQRMDAEPVVETYLFECADDLYGKELEVQFFARIRADMVFRSPEDLKAQIAKDIAVIRACLAEAKS